LAGDTFNSLNKVLRRRKKRLHAEAAATELGDLHCARSGDSPAAGRSYSAFGALFRIQQDLSNGQTLPVRLWKDA
jgi:hypothetical protein